MRALVEWLGGELEIQQLLVVGVLVAARVTPLTFLSPWLALQSLPVIVRAGLAAALTVVLTPTALVHAGVVPSTSTALALALGRETILGTLFAVAAALPLHALEWFGRLGDLFRGATLAETLSPSTGERSSPMADLFLMTGISLFLLIGGHRVLLELLAESFVSSPVGVSLSSAGLHEAVWGSMRLASSALRFAVVLAAPIAVAVVLTEIVLGLVERAAPQVPVFFAGMPLRALVGMAATLASLSVVIGQLSDQYPHALRAASWLLSRVSAP